MVRHLVRLLRKFTDHLNAVLNEKNTGSSENIPLNDYLPAFLCSYYFFALVTKKFLKFTGKCSSQVSRLIVEG